MRLRLGVLSIVVAIAAAAVVVSRGVGGASVERAAGVAAPAGLEELPVLGETMPPLDRATSWLNGPAPTAQSLRGRPVLVEFWTFDCINCQHTLPTLKRWFDRYSADGLQIVTIHSPEFDFERDPSNVADFVHANDLRMLIGLDPDHAVWKDWGIHAWPTFRLFDGEGRLRLQHIGEGGYATTEAAIRQLLGVPEGAPAA